MVKFIVFNKKSGHAFVFINNSNNEFKRRRVS